MLTENYIKSQQIKNAYKQIYLTIPGLIILAVFIVAKFWEQNLQYTIIIWLSLMAVSIIFRLIISLNYFKSNPEDQINKKWEVYYLILIIFIGLLWSFAGVLLYHQQSIFDVAILMVILFGTATGSLVSSSYLPAITLYMPLVILPFTIRLLISFYITEDDTFLFLFFVSFFLFLMIYRVGYSFNKLYKDSFNLSSEKNDLIVNLKDIVKQKSELNKDLKQKILESKRLQELAMDSERDIKNILKNIQEVIFRSDRDGILTWVSDSVHKIFGYKPDEVIGKIYLQDFYSNPDGRDEFIRQIKKNKGIISNYVTKVKRKDNTEIWVSINSNFIYDAVQDKVLGVEGTVRDITEMRLARELQLETELKYRDIVSNVPGIVFQLELSPNGNLTFPYVSYGTMLVLGYEPEEFYKNPNLAFELMPKPDLETVMHDITTTAQSLETSKVEFRMKTKNGSYRWMDTTSTPHKKQDGSVIWDGVIIDVTARKDAEILLIESEARFKDIANNIPGMVYQFMISSDGDMSFPFISSGGIELLGYSEHDTYQNPNLP
ncbi:MAG: PAS domain-containing protein, partial [Spirochaetota bacterium]|nr:PAS domain-containing protein [Spirochaetota bacterium]